MKKLTTLLRKSYFLVGLKKDFKLVFVLYTILIRKRLIKKYFNENKISKLHIGSNITSLEGWLCSDVSPQTKESIYLDATKKFPFEDGVFDYIYSEHMIEHISREEGLFMLRECYRVLKPNGRIRIATPDIEKIVNIYSKRSEKYGSEYSEWITTNFIPNSKEVNPLIVLNTMFRNWYHSFLYDAELLQKTFSDTGFSNIKRFTTGKSADENFKGIEKHHLNVGNFEMVEFETMIFEAEKVK